MAPPLLSSEGCSNAGWRLEHSYSALPELFYKTWKLSPVAEPKLIFLNRALAEDLGLDADALELAESVAIFAGNALAKGSVPLAQAYAGHQFGNFTTLGDGRALLLGEQITPAGQRVDIQLKGSGRTPFSRGGDGRAAMAPMLREYVISEAMHALGIPTTRSLAVVSTGEWIQRQEPQPGAILTRVAASHIRIGTFEWAAAQRDPVALQALVDYTLQRHYPDRMDSEYPALELLRVVGERQVALVAQWMQVGFVHGVLNTDNVTLSGETIDYGPCAFIDRYDPKTVFSSIDRGGRYAFGRQAAITQWNLARLAEALLPLLHDQESDAIDSANDVLGGFLSHFQSCWLSGFRAKLGLLTEDPEDQSIIEMLLEWLQTSGRDYTNCFASLSCEDALASALDPDPAFILWHDCWKARLARQAASSGEVVRRMRAANPVLIPRNHIVEGILEGMVLHNDQEGFNRMLSCLKRPYDYAAAFPHDFLQPAPAANPPYQTFCGT